MRRGRRRCPAPAFPRYGRYSRRLRRVREACADGRPPRVPHPWVRADAAQRGCLPNRHRACGIRRRGTRVGVCAAAIRRRLGTPRSRRGRAVSHSRRREPASRRCDAHVRARRQPELRQDDLVQPAHRLKPACGKLPGRDGRPQGGPDQGPSEHERRRLARHLLDVALQQRGDRLAPVHPRREAKRHHQHRRCDQHRTKPVPDHAAHGARRADGARPQHDGRSAGQRRLDTHQRARRHARHPSRAHLGSEQRRRQRARQPRHSRCALPRAPWSPGLLRRFRQRWCGASLPSWNHAPCRGPCTPCGSSRAVRGDQAGGRRPERYERPRFVAKRARDGRPHRRADGRGTRP